MTCLLLACGNGSHSSKDSSSYADSTDGLHKLIADLVDRARDGHEDKARELARKLKLPDPRAWFVAHFGTPLGEQLARNYEKVSDSIDQLVPLLAKLRGAGYDKIVVERFDKPDDPASVAYQSMALKKMDERTPLYSVRMVKTGEARGFHLWSFVYADDGFRWVGKMTAVADGSSSATEHDKNELRLRELGQAKAPPSPPDP